MLDIDFSKLQFSAIVTSNDLQGARDHIVSPILALAADLGYCSQDQFALRLGLEEALSNAFRHGNKCCTKKKIKARWAVDDRQVVIFVSDDGPGFTPGSVPDPRKDENLEKPSGRGLMLMKAYMTEIRYNEQGNEVCLIKLRKSRSTKTPNQGS
jgi:serine/threonine-protein kinase RsbW